MTSKGFLSKKDIISASSTAVIWIILLVLSLTIQPEIETRYEVIQLVFEDEPVQEAEKQVIETPVEKVI